MRRQGGLYRQSTAWHLIYADASVAEAERVKHKIMKQVELTISENVIIANDVWRMVLSGDASSVTTPGQFINIALPGHFLRRPISVCDYDNESITILYKVAGEGTEEMTALPAGTRLDVLTGLGNGFDISRAKASGHALLLGGGIGSAPMLALSKALAAEGIKTSAVLGFNTAADAVMVEELRATGAAVTLMTMDGSGLRIDGISCERGTVVDAAIVKAVNADPESAYYYACGPIKMLRAVHRSVKCDGELSFEERMGCGFGACMGCTMHTAGGAKRVCKDGPVFTKFDILWD